MAIGDGQLFAPGDVRGGKEDKLLSGLVELVGDVWLAGVVEAACLEEDAAFQVGGPEPERRDVSDWSSH